MKREKLKKILLNYYREAAANHILRGIRKPSYENMLHMHEKDNVPFNIWQDIKSYLQENDTKQSTHQRSANSNQKVS
jgi:hypothetical protein